MMILRVVALYHLKEKAGTERYEKSKDKVTVYADGSVDLYFGPKAPEGRESSWLSTDPNRRFVLLARFYGAEPALFDGSFGLNNVE